MGVSEYVAVGSVIVAVVSMALNAMVVGRQARIELQHLQAASDAELFRWASEAIDAFGEAMATARGLGGRAWTLAEAKRRVRMDAERLSTIADKGRMFFPNLEHPTHGAHKPEAFRGKRPAVLHALIYSSYLASKLDPEADKPDEEAAFFFFNARRLLVNEVQRALDPRGRKAVMRKLGAAKSEEDEPAYEELTALRNTLKKRAGDMLSAEHQA